LLEVCRTQRRQAESKAQGKAWTFILLCAQLKTFQIDVN